ncbi:MAG: HI0074 family nucleotidyltransferase substrate-binding subunit [Defluviitaleaceae bacterium]|nr:HI0074 family nucleotidyltransferase substrate-binding subunit [Defluviitaleaceae bacterium]
MESIYNEIRKIAAKYHVDKILLFGSRARGDNTPKSDIDIAVYFADGYFEQERVAFSLEVVDDVPTLYEINVVCVNDDTDERLLKNIQEDGVTLYMKERKSDHYKNAVLKLKEASTIYAKSGDELHRDGLIQRFEFTFELAWKAMKEYLEAEGYSDAKTPKAVLKKAFSIDLIDSEDWYTMLEDRNMTSHIYHEGVARSIGERILSRYVALFDTLISTLLIQ